MAFLERRPLDEVRQTSDHPLPLFPIVAILGQLEVLHDRGRDVSHEPELAGVQAIAGLIVYVGQLIKAFVMVLRGTRT